MKLLITGLSGFIGSSILEDLSRKHQITSFSRASIPSKPLIAHFQGDLKNPSSIYKAVREIQPDAIILLGAISSLYKAQKDPLETFLINTKSVEYFIRAAKLAKLPTLPKIIFFSTDLVYDGYDFENPSGYKETDPAHPKSRYGRSKLEAEHLLQFYEHSLVLRIALTYGSPRTELKGYVGSIRKSIAKNETINLFSDEWRTPIQVREIGNALIEILELKEKPKLLHLAGNKRLSRAEFGIQIIKGIEENYKDIKAVKREDVALGNLRGIDCSLNNQLIQKVLKMSLNF